MVIADRLTEAANHCSDLRIEDGRWQSVHELQKNLQILARRVEHLDHVFIAQKIEQRRQGNFFSERIDRGKNIWACDLHQAELRPIGLLAHELRIDGDEIGVMEWFAKGGKGFSISN